MKKIIITLFSVCAMIGLSFTTFAYSDIEENTTVSEAVNVLSDLNIVNGFENGSFKPDQTVTRAEMAKMICEILNVSSNSFSAQMYNDVSKEHWGFNYINSISSLGIVNGYGDGNYGPDDIVTFEQAIKMIVCALGYEPAATEKGGYPNGYITIANSLGLLTNVTTSKRGDIAVLIYNALETPIMEQTTYGENPSYEIMNGENYKTLLTKKDIYKFTGIVGENCGLNKIIIAITKDSKDGEFKKNDYIKLSFGEVDMSNYAYQKVSAYVKRIEDTYSIVSLLSIDDSKQFSITSNQIISIDSNKIKYYSDNSRIKTLQIDEDIIIELNKNTNIIDNISFFEGQEDIELMFIENDGDSSYDAVIATCYFTERISKVDSAKNKIILNDETINIEDNNITIEIVDEKERSIKLSKLNENDVVAYFCDEYIVKNGVIENDLSAASYIKIMLLSNSTVSGEITTVSSTENIVTIGKNEYEVIDTIWDSINQLGATGVFYLDKNNKIFDFEGTINADTYGYILRTRTDTSGFDEEIIVEMLTVNGVKDYRTTATVAAVLEEIFDSEYAELDWNGSLDINRFVNYKVNKSGELSKLSAVAIGFSKTLDEETYNSNTESIKNSYIDSNTLVFVLTENNSEDCYITNSNYLVHNGSYTGALYIKDENIKAMFITETDIEFSENSSFAIVTNISTKNIDGEKVFVINYVLNEKEDILYSEDNDFDIGTVFAFNETTNHYISKYKIIANIIDNQDFMLNENYSDNNATFYVGYIFNEIKRTNSKGEIILFSYDGIEEEKTFMITSATNKYTYQKTKKKYNIEIGDFLAGEAYYRENNTVTPVLLRTVNETVTDIYSISSRIEINE